MKPLIIAAAILSAASVSAFASNCDGNCNEGNGGYRGAPGPVVHQPVEAGPQAIEIVSHNASPNGIERVTEERAGNERRVEVPPNLAGTTRDLR